MYVCVCVCVCVCVWGGGGGGGGGGGERPEGNLVYWWFCNIEDTYSRHVTQSPEYLIINFDRFSYIGN